MEENYTHLVIYPYDLMGIFNVNKSGAKYRYSKIKKFFDLKRGQYLTVYHLRDYINMSLEDTIDMIQRNRRGMGLLV
ncbi:hypothetical protein [Pseudopedobacter beijingensis]|uniref:Uncharacterized protein n=1 Tax=Pseudopedobacter beijingensis TaxID=1207056 RepID=A0ABW4IFU9_9SPHI